MQLHSTVSATPCQPVPPEPGRVLAGKYRLEGLIGEGGMGSVWRARNEMLESTVALKIVRPELRGVETSERLLMEARLAARLDHRNVVRVLDCGVTESDETYVVMELLEGSSLSDWMDEQGAVSPTRAVQLLLPAIDALAAAHQAGIVHRDLKPDNIFLAGNSSQLCPKVLDFGIAKLIHRPAATRITGHGVLIGSPAYMSPEQARGLADLDERTDVWAMCVVLYEMLAGEPAFQADNHQAVLCAVIERELAPLSADEALWSILARGLQKDREHRTRSMRELGTALAAWLMSRGVSVDVTGESLARRWQVSEAAAAAPTRPAAVSGNASQIRLRPARRSRALLAVMGGLALNLALLGFGLLSDSTPGVEDMPSRESPKSAPFSNTAHAEPPRSSDRAEHSQQAARSEAMVPSEPLAIQSRPARAADVEPATPKRHAHRSKTIPPSATVSSPAQHSEPRVAPEPESRSALDPLHMRLF